VTRFVTVMVSGADIIFDLPILHMLDIESSDDFVGVGTRGGIGFGNGFFCSPSDDC
jgi:hypothetical protein